MKSDKAFKTSADLKAPILVDHTGKVGKAYGARSTPHMFVIDKEGVLQYQGAFSDQGKTNYVLNAVEAIKAGKTPSPATTKSWGCGIKYASGSGGGKGGKRRGY
jgi:alkyl hydroperoxide reductase subunit AhpC